MKTNAKIILGIIVAVLLSTVSCYALAQNLINSKDVVYEDNSNLVADNVQDAIDGTCSKIDTRLSTIEDKLYTVKDMTMDKNFTSSRELSYTGITIDFPANSMCSISVIANWAFACPKVVALSTSASDLRASTTQAIDEGDQHNFGKVELTVNRRFTKATTYYVWAQYDMAASNDIIVNGWCATKYK